MQIKTKQRAIGAMVILALAALSLSVLFSRPLPGFNTAAETPPLSAASNGARLVYDLSLQGQAVNDSTTDEDELVPLHPLTEAELRSRAAETSAVSEKLLHTLPSPLVIAEKKKENLKDKSAPSVLSASTVEPNDLARDSAAKPVSSAEALPDAWVVQLGSFGDKVNAKHLVNRLRKMHLDVYTRSVGVLEKKTIKVYVGPYIQEDAVWKVQRDLEQQLNLKGVVKKYTL